MSRTRTSSFILLAAVLVGTTAHPTDSRAAGATSGTDVAIDAPPEPVVGGAPVKLGDWRDTAGVVVNNQVICTGVLIAPTVVVTAGHCIDNNVAGVILDTNTLSAEGEQIAALRAIAYPNWQSSYDIGLIELSQPSAVSPRVTATGCAHEFIGNQKRITIVGYGAIDNFGQQYVNELMEADSVITDYDCSDLAHGCNPAIQPDGELGAGGMGIDSCFGDSGGPLYLRTESGDYVVGVTSRGYDNNTLPCSQGGIYTRLDSPAVQSWIESETGVSLLESNCGLPPNPQAQTIEVESGNTEVVHIAPNDPDPGNAHVYGPRADPSHGTITVGVDGTVEYTADAEYEGDDAFSVNVTDDDIPQHTAIAVVTVSVVPGGCGCQSSGGPTGSWWLIFGVVFLLRRSSARVKPRSV